MPSTTHPVSHTCGYEIAQTTYTDTYDITSISDIPERMRPTFVPGAGYIGGVPFDQLSPAYHKLIPIRSTWWKDKGEHIIECPLCHEQLRAEDMHSLT